MKNSTKNIVKKKINLSRKKLIEQPLSIFKKINIENLTKITSLSLKEKYNDFKDRIQNYLLKLSKLYEDILFPQNLEQTSKF